MIISRVRDFIIWFIPDQVKRDKLNSEYLRARVLVSVLALNVLGTLFVAIYSLQLESYAKVSPLITIGIPAFVIAVYLFCMLAYKYTGALQVLVNLYASAAYLAITGTGIISGGIEISPIIQLLVSIPIWSFLMTGRIWGFAWSGIVALTITGFFAAYLLDINFVQLIPIATHPGADYVVWLINLIIVTFCLYIYENHFDGLTQTLEEQNKRFAHDALHDELTALCNRRLFLSHAQQAIDFAVSENLKAAIIYIDLDDFKPVNDTYGHHVGDEVLQIVSHRLKKTVRSSDTVARIGGDEFAVLLHGVKDSGSIDFIANKILKEMCATICVEAIDIRIGASIGVVTIPDDGTDLDTILKLADKAMYQAKISKRNVCFYKQAV